MKTKLLNKDIMIKPEPINDISNSIIHIVSEQEGEANYFQVLQVADGVTEVSKGDIIILPFAMHTEPVLIGSERVAITSEDKILGVLKE